MLNLKIVNEATPKKVIHAIQSAIQDGERFAGGNGPTDVVALNYVRRELAKKLDADGGRYGITEDATTVRVHKIDGAGVVARTAVATITRPETTDELIAEYEHERERNLRKLKQMYEDGRAAVVDVVKKVDVAMYVPGKYTYEVRWGSAVAADEAARIASAALSLIDDGHSVERVLEYIIEDLERNLAGSEYAPTSSSAFSNAVAIERRDVAVRVAQEFKMNLRHLRTMRADCEVL